MCCYNWQSYNIKSWHFYVIKAFFSIKENISVFFEVTPYKWVLSQLSNFLTSAYNTYCSHPELGSPSWDLRISRDTFIKFHSLPRTNPSPSQYPDFKPKLTWNWLFFQTNPNQMTLKGFFDNLVEFKKTVLASLSSLKAVNETYLQGNGSVGQEAGLQGVHQVHIITRHLDPDLLPAQLFIGPLRRAVTAVNNQIRAVSVAHTGLPQSRNYAQKNQHSHGGLSLFCVSNTILSHPSHILHVVLGHDEVQHVI